MSIQYDLMANFTIFTKLLHRRLEGTGLTPGQPKVLDYLYGHNGASQAEIAAACYLEPPSLSAVLNGMEAKGLLERRRKEGDRRSYFIYLTPRGQQAATQVKQTFGALETALLKGLDPGLAGHLEKDMDQVRLVLDGMLREDFGD